MHAISSLDLQQISGANNPYTTIAGAFTNPKPPESGASGGSTGSKPAPPNWNVRPGSGAYGDGWGEDNNGLG